ncbi:hypothetical protein AURDEDRAFT_174462 [Auricularia subglabra TFB-10046 SS5]|uniref:Uncharacterized protein n=1 Tax=Auricularia subglabra (strain TFB-10046 / SS5) TaxID=717982 RepID=J0WUQ6_AURST|nr:hypothetical protein AURDEDRAFT_174462 [Auricularia subglabra TFB-10046 SS5]
MMVSSNILIACSCTLASVVNVFVLNALLSLRTHARQVRAEPSYARHSFIGMDVPLYMISNPRTVALDVEDSVHYDLGTFNDWERYIAQHWQYKL